MTDLQKIEFLRKKCERFGRTYKGVYSRFFDELWRACEEDMDAEWAYNDEEGTDEDFENDVASQFMWQLRNLTDAFKSIK